MNEQVEKLEDEKLEDEEKSSNNIEDIEDSENDQINEETFQDEDLDQLIENNEDFDFKKKDRSGKEWKQSYKNLFELNVRTHFVRFVLSFFNHDDYNLSQDIISVPGFVHSIFRDLPNDNFTLVREIFAKLNDHVIIHPYISKTSKLYLFNQRCLNYIILTYQRFTNFGINISPLMISTRKMIQAVLLTLLTSPSLGILFENSPVEITDDFISFTEPPDIVPNKKDKIISNHLESWPQTSRNINILEFINRLRPDKKIDHQQLIMKLFQNEAHLKRDYIEYFKFLVNPQATLEWFNTITFIMNIIGQRPLDLVTLVMAFRSQVSFERIVNWLIPSSYFNRTFFNQGIFHLHSSVRFVTINLIIKCIQVLEDINYIFKSIPQSNLLTKFQIGLAKEFKLRLPLFENVINLLIKDNLDMPNFKDSHDKNTASLNLDPISFYAQIISLVLSYLREFPDLFVEYHFDFGRFFIFSELWNQDLTIQFAFLDLIEEATPKLKWDSPISKTKNLSMTQLGYLLNVICHSTNSSIIFRIKKIVIKLLRASELFLNSENEISSWINFKHTKYNFDIVYFEKCLRIFSSKPYIYIDALASLIKIQSNLNNEQNTLNLWNHLPSFPESNILLPFSHILLFILKNHSIILNLIVKDELNEAASEIAMEVSSYVLKAIIDILHMLKIPKPLLMVITDPKIMFEIFNDPKLIEHENLIDNSLFDNIFENLSAFLLKIYGFENSILSSGQFVYFPNLSEDTKVLLNLNKSIIEYENFDSLKNLNDPLLILLQIFAWTDRHEINKFTNISFIILQKANNNIETIILLTQALLFHISIFLENENSNQILEFSLDFLTTIFYHTLQFETDNVEIHTLNPSKKILELILTNPSLNTHFLRDVNSSNSRKISEILTTILTRILNQLPSKEFVDEIKKWVSEPFSKLLLTFKTFFDKNDSLQYNLKNNEALSFIIKTMIKISQFISKADLDQIIDHILNLPFEILYSENQNQFDLLLDLLIHLLSSKSEICKLKTMPSLNHLLKFPLYKDQNEITYAWSCSELSFEILYAPSLKLNSFLLLINLMFYLTEINNPYSKIIEELIFKTLITTMAPSFNSISDQLSICITTSLIDLIYKKQLSIHKAAISSTVPFNLEKSKNYIKTLKILSHHPSFYSRDNYNLSQRNDYISKTNEIVDTCKTFESYILMLIPLYSHCIYLLSNKIVEESNKFLQKIAKAFRPFVQLVQHFITLESYLYDPTTKYEDRFELLLIIQNYGVSLFLILVKHETLSLKIQLKANQNLLDFLKEDSYKEFIKTVDQLELQSFLIVNSKDAKILIELLTKSSSTFMEEFNNANSSFKKESYSKLIEWINKNLKNNIKIWINMKNDEIITSVKRILRNGYEHVQTMKLIFDLISRINYSPYLILELHNLIISHSKFPEILLNNFESEQKIDFTKNNRFTILNILFIIYSNQLINLQVFSPNLLSLYLSSYNATLTPEDKKLFQIIMIFESKSVNFSQAGYLWGKASQDYRIAIQREAGHSMTSFPKIDLETVNTMLFGENLIQYQKILRTIKYFPVNLPLNSQNSDLEDFEQNYSFEANKIYDPRFLLSIYYFAINNFKNFNSQKFIELGGLSLTFMATSSKDDSMRSLAYSILAKFNEILENLTTLELRQCTEFKIFVAKFKNSISESNIRLSSITSSFLSNAALILIRPEKNIFYKIFKNISSKPTITTYKIPIFMSSMMNSSKQIDQERQWILNVIQSGLRSSNDVLILRSQNVIHTLLTFQSSSIVFPIFYQKTRILIWNILSRLLYLDGPNKYINTLGQGYLNWISHWTLSHTFFITSKNLKLVHVASVPSLQVFCEVSILLTTFSQLLENSDNHLSFSPLIWSQVLPIISNLVVFINLLDSFQNPIIKISVENKINEKLKLISPIISMLYCFSKNLPTPPSISLFIFQSIIEILFSLNQNNKQLQKMSTKSLLESLFDSFSSLSFDLKQLHLKLASSIAFDSLQFLDQDQFNLQINIIRYSLQVLIFSSSESPNPSLLKLVENFKNSLQIHKNNFITFLISKNEDNYFVLRLLLSLYTYSHQNKNLLVTLNTIFTILSSYHLKQSSSNIIEINNNYDKNFKTSFDMKKRLPEILSNIPNIKFQNGLTLTISEFENHLSLSIILRYYWFSILNKN